MGRDRGSLSPAVVILAVMILTLAGLVMDGGRQLSARSRAIGYAQEAARAGAASIDLNADAVRIDVRKAEQQIAAFCRQVRANDPTVTKCERTALDAEHARVHVQLDNKTTLLAMIGVPKLTAHGDGEAHAEQGINRADETPTVPPLTVIPTQQPPDVTIAPTATEPTLDIPCPTRWTIGSPTPTWTIPFPFPTTCTPSLTPTSPTESPTETTTR